MNITDFDQDLCSELFGASFTEEQLAICAKHRVKLLTAARERIAGLETALRASEDRAGKLREALEVLLPAAERHLHNRDNLLVYHHKICTCDGCELTRALKAARAALAGEGK